MARCATTKSRELLRLAAALPALCLAQTCPHALAAGADEIFAEGFELPCPGAAAGVTPGSGAALLLRGTVVTPASAFVGEVLVQGDTIACAAMTCAAQPGAATATIVETQGLIFPGLIDSHDHALFDLFDDNDWTPPQVYANHNGWGNDAGYAALLDAKQYLNGETSAVDYGCEMEKYGELKALLAGVTSTMSHAGVNRSCYGSLVRTVDEASNDLGADYIQTSTLFPTMAVADDACARFTSGATHAFVVDIGEGTDMNAASEFLKLGTVSTTDGCLYAPQTAIAHGTALGDADFTQMAASGMSLVWTPHSDVALYGATANVPLALDKGINVALGTNWSITGSHHLLAELRYADAVDNAQWGDRLSAYDLVQMATTHAASALHLNGVLGSIVVDGKADLTVIGGTCSDPWSTLLHAREADVRLVMVGGVTLYGDTTMRPAAPSAPGCETLDVCGVPKFVCVAEAGGTPSNLFAQTLTDIVGRLSSGLADYDASTASSDPKFSPLAPLVDCR